MPVDVVTGAPFSGKGRYVRSEIARREAAGELGLVSVDYSAVYSAVVPGVQSSLRDQAVVDSGAPRFAGYLFEAGVAQAALRELNGYVTTPSPARAVELSGRLEGRLLNIDLGAEDLGERIEEHMAGLEREVTRAARGEIVGRCRDAAVRYLREKPKLVGRARNVVRDGDRYRDDGPVQAFDRDNFRRGLTLDGREVVAQLEADGFTEWHPPDILNRLLLASGRR